MEEFAFIRANGMLVKNKENHLTFLPKNLPPKIKYDEGLIGLVSEANIQLGRLSGIGTLLPNPHLLIRPYVFREAVLSSKIEGTQASILDVFRFEAGGADASGDKEGKRTKEVVNYINALDNALDLVRNGKDIDKDLILRAHKTLMQDVRGHEPEPGKFRTVQNWIGVEGTKIADATYVPPAPENVPKLLTNLEKFIQKPPGIIPVVVQCAIMHYQFEAIHPFTDGNGRIGRLLIPLLLAHRRVLDQPLLYLSAYIESNKTKYYKLLLEVSQKSAWEEWIRFFLVAVITQARDASDNIQRLMALKASYEEKLRSKKASGSAILLSEYLFANPLITVPAAAKYLNMTYPPAKKAIEYLVDMEILREENFKARNRMYTAHEIYSILS